MVEPLAPMVLLPEPELPPAAVLGVVPVLEPLAPAAVLSVLGVPVLEPLAPAAVLPVLGVPGLEPLAPAAVLPVPPGVPVVPMGVCCELCCPAPVAGSFAAGSGGVLWAMAAPAIETAAKLASTPLNEIDTVISGTP